MWCIRRFSSINDELTLKKFLQMASVVFRACCIIKGIIDGEDPIKEISSFIQKDINRQDSNMGSVG
jgi:hypothetical protein